MRKSPLATWWDRRQTGHCGANWGATPQKWQKTAVPRPLARVYFGTKVTSPPSAWSGPQLCAAGKQVAKGSSQPDDVTNVSALGAN